MDHVQNHMARCEYIKFLYFSILFYYAYFLLFLFLVFPCRENNVSPL
jgi:hypothetical protein